jgi:hypothetical protein
MILMQIDILCFYSLLCLFAFKFPRSGLVQLVIDRFTRAREPVIYPNWNAYSAKIILYKIGHPI